MSSSVRAFRRKPRRGQHRDEALGLEVEQGLAQGSAADAEAAGDVVEVEKRAGLEAAARHLAPEVVVDLLPEGASLQNRYPDH